MNFNTLEEKCLYYRDLQNHRLMPGAPVLIMLDGRSFSRKIKNKFQKPFDDFFIEAMNTTMKYLCENIQGCKFGYCQSDEISLYLSDINEKGNASSFFEFRLCKIQSICASMATSKFNQIMMMRHLELNLKDLSEVVETVNKAPLYEFDCKAWSVPNTDFVEEWFLYRQNDCMRNAKNQAARTYLSHKQLNNLKSEEQIKLLKELKGIDFEDYDLGKKQGRVCIKKEVTETSEQYGTYTRGKWFVEFAPRFKHGYNII